MRKLIVLVIILLVASMAFGQTGRTTQDTKLGKHDVQQTTTAGGALLGCQSCHIPHAALGDEYIFKYALASGYTYDTVTLDPTDANAFHTLACMTCHDGASATDINMPTSTRVFTGKALAPHNHPVHEVLKQRSTGSFNGNFVSFRKTGITNTVEYAVKDYNYGYVECGTCHDPHKGDTATYKFLRGPSATKPASADPGTKTVRNLANDSDLTINTYGYGYTYTATNADWARLGLCRDCHSK